MSDTFFGWDLGSKPAFAECHVFAVAPGNAHPRDIVVTYDWSRKPWEPCVYRNGNYRRLPRKLKKRLTAHTRRLMERELAMVEAWWNARRGR